MQAVNSAYVLVFPGCSKVSTLVREDDFLDLSSRWTNEFHSDFLVTNVVNFDRTILKTYSEHESIRVEFDLGDCRLFLEFCKRNTLLNVVEAPSAV